jgi:hypothetical protein
VHDGAASVAGSQVTAFAWPSQAAIAAAGTADLTLLPVARAPSAADGSYALSADLAAVSSTYREPDGAVNLDVYVDNSPVALTAAPSGSPAALARVGVVSPATPGRVSLDRSAGSLSVTADGHTARTAAVRPTAAPATGSPRASKAGATDVVAPMGCVSHTIATYTGKNEPFLHLYSNANAPAYVTETSSSEHALGVGFSASGTNWSANGTATLETHNSSALTHGFAHNWTVFNRVTYRKYGTSCVTIGTGVGHYTYSVRPIGFYDIISSATALPEMGYKYCRTAKPGEIYTKIAGSNLTFTAGVQLGFFSASARAGYSRSTEVQWKVKTSGSYMCGNTTSWLNAQNAGIKKAPKGGNGCAPLAVGSDGPTDDLDPTRPC